MVFSNCSKAQQISARGLNGDKLQTAFSVGNVEIPVSYIDKSAADQLEKMKMQFGGSVTDPRFRVQAVAGAIGDLVQQAECVQIAQKQGFNGGNDDDVKKALHFTSEKDFRDILTTTFRKVGQLKPNSTDKDLDDLAEKQGVKISDIYKKNLEDAEKKLKDPADRPLVVMQAAQRFISEKILMSINPTDDDLKKQFESVTFKQITIKTDAKVTDDQAKAKADKAEADLKAGKSFEDTMDAYSEEAPMPGKKKKSENEQTYPVNIVGEAPDFKPLLALKPGGYSDPVKVGTGYTIFKLIDRKIKVPDTFEKQKDQIRTSFISQESQKQMKEQLDKIEKEVKPSFQIKAYEAAYIFMRAQSAGSPDETAKAVQNAFDIAKTVGKQDPGYDIGISIAKMSSDVLFNSPKADKAKLKADRLKVLESYVEDNKDWASSKEVIDNYKDAKNGDAAYHALTQAFDKNLGFDIDAQRDYSEISAKFLELKAAGLIKPEQEKEFLGKQKQWSTEKTKYDQEQALIKKQEDEARKKAEEDAKKAKANAPKTPAKGNDSSIINQGTGKGGK